MLPLATMMGGIYIANQIDQKLMKPATQTVSGIMGIDGVDSKTVTPLLMAGVGVAVHHFVDNEHVKNLAKGTIMYAGYRAIESFTGKKVTLNGIEDEIAPALPASNQVRGLEGKDEDALRQALEIAMAKPVSGAEATTQEVASTTVSGLGEVSNEVGNSETQFMGQITPEILSGSNDEFGDIDGYDDINGLDGDDDINGLDGDDDINGLDGLDGDGEPLMMY